MEKLDECARQLLDAAPQIMRSIRAEMRSHRGHDLSIPQFRTLTFIHQNPEASLSHLAEHLGLTLPSTSKLVDGLVNEKIISRRESKEDRRKLMLALTKNGEDILNVARGATQNRLKDILHELPAEDLSVILRALNLLQPLFMKEAKTHVPAHS